MTEPDYVTIGPTNDPHKFLVLVMRWSHTEDGHIAVRASARLSHGAANALCVSWAAALKLEIRL